MISNRKELDDAIERIRVISNVNEKDDPGTFKELIDLANEIHRYTSIGIN